MHISIPTDYLSLREKINRDGDKERESKKEKWTFYKYCIIWINKNSCYLWWPVVVVQVEGSITCDVHISTEIIDSIYSPWSSIFCISSPISSIRLVGTYTYILIKSVTDLTFDGKYTYKVYELPVYGKYIPFHVR